MSVQIVKPKAKEIAKEDLAQIVSAEDVDEYAEQKAKLDKQNAKIAPLAKQVASMEKGILGVVDALVDPGTSVELVGNKFEMKLGAQGKRTDLTEVEKVFDMLGAETFFKLATISTTNLNKYLTPDQLAEVTESKYAIKRRVKVEAL